MFERLKELERLSKQLEPDAETRKKIREKVVDYTESFLNELPHLKAFDNTDSKGEGLLNSPISEFPAEIEEIIQIVKDNVDSHGLNPASGGHLGYVPGGGIYYASLGDYMADITNRYAGIFYTGQGAVRMENMLIRWMAGIVGYPQTTYGNLSSGGSIANLAAIVTARDAHKIKSMDVEKTVVYLTEHLHHCIDKSLRIAGLRECVKRYIPLDNHFRMIPEILKKTIEKDLQKGLSPWLVLASAGTTDTGAIDPLDVIGDIAKEYNLWFHVDGAYGAFFALCEEGKKMLKGIEKSDSIVMDPHKTLFLPYGLGVVMVKDGKKLSDAHHYQANYMQDAFKEQDEISPADTSPELTKPFRGMRLWLPLKLLGIAPFRAALEEKLLLGKYFYTKIRETEGFETGPSPDLSVVMFRYIPEAGDADSFNEKLVEEIKDDGRVFFSSTRVNNTFMIRAAIVSFRTHVDTIDFAIDLLKEKVKKLSVSPLL